MPTPESRVAKALKIAEPEARELIRQVQALLDHPPEGARIARCLEAYTDMPRTPEGVAAKLVRLGWAGSLKEPEQSPPAAIPKARREAAGKREDAPRVPRRKKQNVGNPPPKMWPEPETIEPDTLDKTHVPVDRLPTCPHGIPKTRPCAICEPERFKMLSDPD
ncbi:MAG: hypothetical protein JXM73_02635 [Anaerolineae bacterium]|nr:hypothetical protein [Anaerolineae bacterium]